VSHNETWHSRARGVLAAAGLEWAHDSNIDTAIPRSSDVA
jgi:hypothetical protein